ncbi:hypothetical protein Dda_3658 [Drechslerella dactyloides]|uniref:Uncharacterized protein n=1 Tax=Drechslerella dactyloides TaxID=74499 RepID=A0AAD6NLB6_DREDA|nr:hypothetical protein Dda_3658 [Drechslerella dactyloides]
MKHDLNLLEYPTSALELTSRSIGARHSNSNQCYTPDATTKALFYTFTQSLTSTDSSSGLDNRIINLFTPGCTYFAWYQFRVDPPGEGNTADQRFFRCQFYSAALTSGDLEDDSPFTNVKTVQWLGFQALPRISYIDGYTYTPYGDAAIKAPHGTWSKRVTAATGEDCAAACDAVNAGKTEHNNGSTFQACNFFNFYYNFWKGAGGVVMAEAPATTCVLYGKAFDVSNAADRGRWVHVKRRSVGYPRLAPVGDANGVAPV